MEGEQEPASFEQAAIYPQTLEEALAERITRANERLGAFYDTSTTNGKNPVEAFIADLKIPRLEKLYGSAAVTEVINQLHHLPTAFERQTFITAVRGIVEPFLRAELADPEVRRRMDALNASIEVELKDEEADQSLRGHICAIDHDIVFQDQTMVKTGETVFEIAWPKKGPGPSGLHGFRKLFGKIAGYLATHEDIRAVTGVSWMMSHPVAQRMGFEAFPEAPFPNNQRTGSAGMGNDAREAKGLAGDISPEEVLFGECPENRSSKDTGRRFFLWISPVLVWGYFLANIR